MKKLLSVLLVCLLAFSFAAFAEEAAEDASKTVADTTTIEAEGLTGEEGFYIIVAEDQEEAEAQLTVIEETGADEYFGEAAEAAKEYVATDDLTVYEFMAIEEGGYDAETMDDLKLHMTFATPFEEGQKVAVLVGIQNDMGAYDWTTLEAVGTADGGLDVIMTEELLEAPMANKALLAVVG